jgi:hypothetical protein
MNSTESPPERAGQPIVRQAMRWCAYLGAGGLGLGLASNSFTNLSSAAAYALMAGLFCMFTLLAIGDGPALPPGRVLVLLLAGAVLAGVVIAWLSGWTDNQTIRLVAFVVALVGYRALVIAVAGRGGPAPHADAGPTGGSGA